jgi:hypothetical protein
LSPSRIEKAAVYAAAYVAVLMSDFVAQEGVMEAAERVIGTAARRRLAHQAACEAVRKWAADNLWDEDEP